MNIKLIFSYLGPNLIQTAICTYLLQKIGCHLNSYLEPSYSNTTNFRIYNTTTFVVSEPRSIEVEVNSKIGTSNNLSSLEDDVLLLTKLSQYYYAQIPLLDRSEFIRWCFEHSFSYRDLSPNDKLTLKVFATLIQPELIPLALLDEDKLIRDLAKFLMK